MATEAAAHAAHQAHDASPDGRRRLHFPTWVRKLRHFKHSSSQHVADPVSTDSQSSRQGHQKRNPYGHHPRANPTRDSGSADSVSTIQSDSVTESAVENGGPAWTAAARSVAPTVGTDHEGARSIAPSGVTSVTGTGRTAGGGVDSRRGGDSSTFSSPAPSVRSLTTTLTTIQSVAPPAAAANNPVVQFHHPFPPTPASAIPAHLAPPVNAAAGTPGHPTTYATATANNLLTDDASILTLASSSKRRRRRSLDTDASVRALAPSSLWGGSRESLPLSVLSASIDMPGGPATPGLHQSGSSRMIGAGPVERTSIYSAGAGAGPPSQLLQAERTSFYARNGGGDGGSIRSGLLSHGRAESVNGSIGGLGSPLASPREVTVLDRKDEAV